MSVAVLKPRSSRLIRIETRIVRTVRDLFRVQSRIVGTPGVWIDTSAPKICRADAEAFRASLTRVTSQKSRERALRT